MHVQSSIKWLKIASATLIGFGFLSVLGAHPSVDALARWFISIAIWPFAELTAITDTETRLLWAILGGICVGWGVMFWLLTTQLFEAHSEKLRPIMIKAVLSWFVVDSLASIASGAAFNAVLNLSFLALFLYPLWRPVQIGDTATNLETNLS